MPRRTTRSVKRSAIGSGSCWPSSPRRPRSRSWSRFRHRERPPMSTRLAMFPLGTVLVPHGVLPLHVFEPRYRVLMFDCLRGTREFGVVLIERGSEVGGDDQRFAVATVARIEAA